MENVQEPFKKKVETNSNHGYVFQLFSKEDHLIFIVQRHKSIIGILD